MQRTFTGVYVNINQLGLALLQWLESKGYKTQILSAGQYIVVQAKKEGILRTIFGANRAFTVRLSGGQGVLTVDVGMSDWLKAADVTEDVIAAMIFTPLAVIEGVEEVWNIRIEEDIMKEIERLISIMNQPMMGFQQPIMYPQPMMYQQQKVCRSCGFSNPINARFCMNCGSPL
ncbi:zinc ribbon domain-containing protein [Sulfurisphaera javensis]|uniref:Zinc ribbon domain-containing protein n=1 Tax=Sulfurisphaera javensis TaxID=2049879 RepID=A0AAT9GSL8_9CREN